MLYPVNLDIAGRLCLVFGGGTVAARKIEALLVSEAFVRVISPEACGKIRGLAASGAIEWRQRCYRQGDCKNGFLVFAATSSQEVQSQIAAEANGCGALLNSADDPHASDFQVPAKLRRGRLLIAVSTNGGSPALAARIKHELAREFGSEYELLVELLHSIRQEVVGGGPTPEENKRLFHEVIDLPVLDCLKSKDWDALAGMLAGALPATIDSRRLVAGLQKKSGRLSDERQVDTDGTRTVVS